MSKEIDEKVVQMRFDNAQFEKNVSQTMNTVEKLKASLKFDKTGKSFDNITASAKRVDLSALSRGAETIATKFSTMEIVAITAISNLTNSAVNAGKRISSALTIDPVKTGLKEYETKMNAMQVLKANTRGKNDMAEIEKALDELNEYADNTIYNYMQMVSNAGKFTAQGLDVEQAKNAIIGLANLAGASGASAEDMSRATYQMSQALGGVIRKIDWNSLRNANMATMDLKNTLMDLAKVRGIDIDGMIADKGTFEDTLEKGWLTGEMFTEAMNIYSDVYSEAELRAKGFNDEQIANFKDLAAMAKSATTEVKTLSQLWDVLKETAQSGWTQTWELIVGDFESAKKMFTQLQVFFSNIINKWSDAINWIIGGAMNFVKPWTAISAKLGNIKEAAKAVANMSDSLEYYQEVVSKVWHGDYNNRGDNPDRYKLLDEAGYNHKVVQDLVNKGYQYKLTMADVEESQKKFGISVEKSSDAVVASAKDVQYLSDEMLTNAGLTADEIKLYRDLEAEAKRTGKSISEIADEMSKTSGRTLLLEGLANIGKSILSVFTAIKDAWDEIFPPISIVRVYNMIKAFNEFSQKLIASERILDNVKRTCKGVFAIFKIFTTLLGGGFKLAFRVANIILEAFGMNILDATAVLGDLLVKFSDWILKDNLVIKGVEAIARGIAWLVKELKKLYNEIKNLPKVQLFISKFREIGKSIIDGLRGGIKSGISATVDIMKNLGKRMISAIKKVFDIHSPSKKMFEIGANIIKGLINGIKSIGGKAIDGAVLLMKDLGNGIAKAGPKIWDGIKAIGSGISKAFNGFKMDTAKVLEKVKSFVSTVWTKTTEFVSQIDFGKVAALVVSGLILAMSNKIIGIAEALSAPLKGVGDVLSGTGKLMGSLGTVIEKSSKKINKILNVFSKSINRISKAISFKIRVEAIKTLAVAIAIMAGSVIALSLLDPDKMWGAVDAIMALVGVLGGLALVASQMPKIGSDSALKATEIMGLLMAISGAVLLIGLTAKSLGSMDPDQMEMGLLAVTGIIGLVGILVGIMGQINAKSARVCDRFGKTMIRLAGSMVLMALVIKMIGSMSWGELAKGGALMGGMLVMITAMTVASKIGGRAMTRFGATMQAMGVALLLMAVSMKLIATMSLDDITKGLFVVTQLALIIAGLVAITRLAGENIADSLGRILIGMSAVMLAMGIVIKMVGGMDPKDIDKGIWAVTRMTFLVGGLVSLTQFAKNDSAKIALTLLALSVSIGILAAVAVVLSMIDTGGLVKGVLAVSVLVTVFKGLVKATRGAQDCKGNLIAMTVAIGVLAASAVALSFIDTAKMLTSVLGISAMLLAFGGACKLASGMGGSLGALIVMTVAIAVLAGAVFLIAQLPVENALAACSGLSVLLLAMAGALAIASAVGPMAILGIVALGLMTVIVGMLGIIIALMCKLPIENVMSVSKALSLLLLSMSASMLILTVVGALAPAALLGIGMLMTMIISIGALAVAIGKLMTENEQMEAFLNKGMPILAAISKGIGSIIGNFVAGLAEGVMSALPNIGKSLSEFYENGKSFFEGMSNLDEGSMKAVGALAKAMVLLTATDLLNGIKNLLGIGSKNPFEKFGQQLEALGPHIVAFSNSVKGVDDSNIETAAKITESMIKVAKKVPNDGGWLGAVAGNNDIGAFGEHLAIFGRALVKYTNSIKNISDEGVDTAVKVTEDMIDVAKKIPNDGGWLAAVAGNNNIATFGANMALFATSFVEFSNTMSKAKNDKIKDNIPALSQLVDIFKNMTDIKTNAATKFGTMITVLKNTMNNAVVGDAKSFSDIGVAISDNMLSGLNTKVETAKTKSKEFVTKMVNAIKSKTSAMTKAGESLGSALIKGIQNKNQAVYDAAKVLGQQAVDGESKGQQSRSPSVAMIRNGKYLGEGLIIGMNQMSNRVNVAGHNMGSEVINSISTSITQIGDLIDSGMDTTPTIRPVFDLSGVQRGVDSVGSMLNFNSGISLNANVNAVNSMMNKRNQNGGNSDVVKSIEKLGNKLNTSRNTYNFGNVSYDDNTAVSNAVEELVRAVTADRRS